MSILKSFYNLFPKLAIDIGTSKIIISDKNKILIEEPPIIAIVDNEIIIGKKAKKLYKKNSKDIKVFRPVQDGVITDVPNAELLFSELLKRTSQSVLPIRPDIVYATNDNMTDAEKRTIASVLKSAGARHVYEASTLACAARGSGIPFTKPIGFCIVEIGAGVTSMALMSYGGIINQRSFNLGGNKITQNIVRFFSERGYKIDFDTANKIKENVASATLLKKEKILDINVYNKKTSSIEVIQISSNNFVNMIQETLQDVIIKIKNVLDLMPPDLVSDIANHGIVLSGGTARLHNISKYLESKLHVRVAVLEDPEYVVIKGLRTLIDNINTYKETIRLKI